MPTPIDIQIDELILEGFEPGERHSIADSLIAELTRLFGARDTAAPFEANSHDVIETSSVTLPETARPKHIGAQIAQAVFTGLHPKE